MYLPVCFIVELVGKEIAVRMLASHDVSLLNGPIGALLGRGEQNFHAIGLHDLAALNTGRLGHDKLALVSFDCTDHGQANTGVTAGRFQDNLVRGQGAALFGSLDHRQSDTVLDRTSRIKRF